MTKDIALLVLRLSGFGLAIAHGWPKVGRLLGEQSEAFVASIGALGFPFPLVFAWAATFAELVGGLAIAFGLFTRIAAAFAAFTMFVAAFLRHHFFQHVLIFLGVASYPEDVVESWGNPERALAYLLIFLGLVLLGGGRFALDRFVRKSR